MEAIDQLLATEGEEAVKRRLPRLLQEIASFVGVREAYALANTFGGTRIEFTERGSRRLTLEKLIGVENAAVLHSEFGGEEVSIPKADGLTLLLRNRDLLRRWENGESAGALARRFQLTERQVYYIVAIAPRNQIKERQT